MFDPEVYCKACSGMTLDAEKIEEMIIMTENTSKKPIHRPLRVMVLAAALTAALAVTAGAANVGGFENLWNMFFTTFSVHVEGQDGTSLGLEVPQFTLHEEEGRTIFTVEEERLDITDELEGEGAYTYRRAYVDSSCVITVHADGKVDVSSYDGQGKLLMGYSTVAKLDAEHTAYNVITGGQADADMEGISVDPVGSVAVDGQTRTGVYNITTD